MARKFKKHLAQKQNRLKTETVLSVSLIRKEYRERFLNFWNKIISKVKKILLSN